MKDDSSIRGELLDLLPVVSHRFGLGRAALDHLVWLIRRTRAMDWRPGNRAVVYQSVEETAAERGITPRQVNNHERAIAEAFGCQVSCPSCRRYGQRDKESGRIVHASGLELTNLQRTLASLRAFKADLDREHERRRRRKRELTAVRGQVRRLANAVFAIGDDTQAERARSIVGRIGARVSTHEVTDIDALESRIRQAEAATRELKTLLLSGKTCGSDGEISNRSEENFRHIDPSLDLQSTLTGGCSPEGDNAARKPAGAARRGRPAELSNECRRHASFGDDYEGTAFVTPEETGANRVTFRLAVQAASDRFRARLPFPCRPPTADDLVDAARSLSPELGIGRAAWSEACQIVGPYPAALCVLLADRATIERDVTSPGGYFRAMIRRAKSNRLAIERSVFGLAGRECP